ncbi:MAG TPA: glycosyltransferase [Pyrinomonadaceae bacterium]|nr:glycosyltransferase [Pyrinomonadaceae bacterium]
MKVSVIVPVRDEEDSIRELLDSLVAQTRPPDEIVITDGGSTDATPEIIEEYGRNGLPVKLIRAGAALPGRGRNLAAAEAHCEWLAFTDGGIRLDKHWLEHLVTKAEQDESIDIVYGSVEPVTDTFFTECAAIAYVPPPKPQEEVIARPRFIASSLLRREAWAKVKGFPENLRSAEDLLFMERLESAGYRAVFEPRAQVYWRLRSTLKSTFKRFLVYSLNNIRAGLFNQWQARILFRYVMLFVIFVAVLIVEPSWFWLPIALWVLMLIARAIVSIWRNRDCYPGSFFRNVRRTFMVVALLAVLDAAALIGCFQWLLSDSFRNKGESPVEAGDGI